MLHLLHQDPHTWGVDRSRWRLADILSAVEWLPVRSLSGVWRWLHREHISLKHATEHVHSPDQEYLPKLAYILEHLQHSQEDPKTYPLLFEDEITFFRRPSLSFAYEGCGTKQPLAEQGWSKERTWRVAATLDAFTGVVVFRDRARFSIEAMVRFYEQICQAYPHARTIYLVQDNWTLHYHPDVLAALQPQQFPWRLYRPPSWADEPSKKAKRLDLPLQLLPLPTYASWCNPIEKLWRMLRQERLHLHRFRDDWNGLRASVRRFLDQLQGRAQELLRYCGLQDPERLYASAFCNNSPPLRL
jgi:hypothetical protein